MPGAAERRRAKKIGGRGWATLRIPANREVTRHPAATTQSGAAFLSEKRAYSRKSGYSCIFDSSLPALGPRASRTVCEVIMKREPGRTRRTPLLTLRRRPPNPRSPRIRITSGQLGPASDRAPRIGKVN